MGTKSEVGLVYIREPDRNPFYPMLRDKSDNLMFFVDGAVRCQHGEVTTTMIPNSHCGEYKGTIVLTLKEMGKMFDPIRITQRGKVVGEIPRKYFKVIEDSLQIEVAVNIERPPNRTHLRVISGNPEFSNEEVTIPLNIEFRAVAINIYSLPKEISFHIQLDEIRFKDQTPVKEDLANYKELYNRIFGCYSSNVNFPLTKLTDKNKFLFKVLNGQSNANANRVRELMLAAISILQDFLESHYFVLETVKNNNEGKNSKQAV